MSPFGLQTVRHNPYINALLLLMHTMSLYTTAAFDVVGWYVGQNTTNWPLSKLNWDVYSTIRVGELKISDNGTALGCDYSNPAFVEALRLARLHGKTVTLGASFGFCKWKDTNATTLSFCQNYLRTLGPAVRSCGPNIAGIEFDHEGDDETGPFHIPAKYWGRAGLVSRAEARWFTELMDQMQKAMGDNYTVSEDIGVWGFGGFIDRGDEYPSILLTPWVDADLIKANPNLFVNTMSYHWTKNCSIQVSSTIVCALNNVSSIFADLHETLTTHQLRLHA